MCIRDRIETKKLTKIYEEQTAVNSVNLLVKPGRIYGLLGRNGAGKTTIMKMILGLTPVSYIHLHLTGTVIYGYLWDEKREHWLVDEEAAEVVRRIFSLTLEGYVPYQIACKLSTDRIEIPVVHLARFNEGVNRSKPVSYTHLDVYKRQMKVRELLLSKKKD